MYQGTNFGAVDAATVMSVLEWARRTYGGQPWYMDSNYTYDDAGQPYVWLKARSGYPISTPEAKNGVPLKVLVEEAAADVYVVEESPWYRGRGGPWWGGGRHHGSGHHGGGHHGSGHHGLGSPTEVEMPAAVETPTLAPPLLAPIRRPIQVQAVAQPPVASRRKPVRVHVASSSPARSLARFNGFQQADAVTVDSPSGWSRTEVGVVVGLVSLLAGFTFGRMTALNEKQE